ncbi:MAG: hypothetical protein ACLGH8_10480 [Bacteroidia bacterium]
MEHQLQMQNYEQLKKYLEKEIKQHQTASRLKNIVVQLLYLFIIICYALVLLKDVAGISKEFSLAIAGMPGIILLISNTFKYEEKAKWNKLKQRKLESLCRKLIFENASIEEISREISIELEKLDQLRVALNKPDAPQKN